MVSRRKLFSMVLMMAVLFSLFMLTQVYRYAMNDYDTNEYVKETSVRQSDIFDATEGAETAPEGRRVVLIGQESDDFGSVVMQWCNYSKRSLSCFPALSDYLSQNKIRADVLCISPAYLNCQEDEKLLGELYDNDMVIIFGGLPETKELERASKLCEMLGISGVRTDSQEITGIYIYKGFLLGGEVLYRAETEEETKRQDLELNIPWYELGGRTKTYMIGFVEDVNIKREEQPVIVWRNTLGSTKVFAVNGDYLGDETGLGFLEAMMAESYSCTLHPVVNAQNVSVADYPSFASENDGEIQEIYSNSHRMLLQNIVWPALVAVSEQSGFKMTFFLTPQFHYLNGSLPDTELLSYYLRQIRERRGEAGWSADGRDDISVGDKWKVDKEFFEEAGSNYIYTAAFASEQRREEILASDNDAGTTDIRTVVGEWREEEPLLSFGSENITCQGITHRADRYSYSDDLRNRSIQTALGYTNICLDMGVVSWPESTEEHWENYSRKVSGNIGTWWKTFACFDRTTITESDSRLRSFLAVNYTEILKDDRIELKIENREGMVYFLLRTHDRKVDSVSGGSFSQIEDDVYLISVREDEVVIHLAS